MAVNPVYHQTNDRLQEELVIIREAKENPERFGPLYTKYHEQIFRYVYQRMDDQEQKKKLLQCLSLLKDGDLQLIELRYFEKRSYREIGEILEITENNAKVRTFRALERLKKLFMK